MNVSGNEAGERRFHIATRDGEGQLPIRGVFNAINTTGQDAVVHTRFAGDGAQQRSVGSFALEGQAYDAAQGAQVVCLQELFTSLYFCDVEDYENFKLAETIPGPSTDALSVVAAELKVVIVASLFEKRAEGLYHNTTAVLDADGAYLGKYRKMHIPDDRRE